MEPSTLLGLLGLAGTIGFLHTLAGPDHYLPFVAMGKAGGWRLRRTLLVAGWCGAGHVCGSILLGLVGIGAWAGLERLARGLPDSHWLGWVVGLEESRGSVAAWMLLSFGLVYLAWGLRWAARGRPHAHLHVHADGTVHAHEHDHRGEHLHVHACDPTECAPGAPPHGKGAGGSRLTPWVLFTIFALGPCEPLIPILMAPAMAHAGWWLTGLVAVVFGVATIGTMLALVAAGHLGLSRVSMGPLERYSHALAGGAVALCGAAMVAGF